MNQNQIEDSVVNYLVSMYESEFKAYSNNNKIKDLLLWEDTFNLVELLNQQTKAKLDTNSKARVYDKVKDLLQTKGFVLINTKRELQLKTDKFKTELLAPVKELLV